MQGFNPLADELASEQERRLALDDAREFEEDLRTGRREDGEVRHFGRTVVIKSPDDHRMNRVYCLCEDDIDQLDQILAFYDDDHLVPTFFLSPLGCTSKVGQALASAGYYQDRLNQCSLYGSPQTSPTPLPPGVTIELVTPDTIEDYVETAASGFGWDPPWRERAKDKERRRVGRAIQENAGEAEDTHAFLARFEGEPAGVGMLHITENGQGGIGGTAVVPDHRGKGINSALLHGMSYRAHELGCHTLESNSKYGSTSFRNQHRIGLRITYIESIWEKLP